MQKWEYIKFETRRNEIVSINGQDPRKKETWEILGLTFHKILGGRLNEYEFINTLGREGWDIIALTFTEIGTQVMIAKRPLSD